MAVPNTYWKALFDFANRAGASDPVNQNGIESSLRPMSIEDRQFLDEAMKDYVKDADPIRQMKDCFHNLMLIQTASPSAEQIDKAVDSLEYLQDLCADMDLSKDFFTIGGVRLLPFLLNNPNESVQIETLGLIGELSQNHPYSQNQLQLVGVLPVLLNLLKDNKSDALNSRVVFAISCLIRGNPDLEQEFVNADGLNLLVSHLEKSVSHKTYRTGSKISFLLAALADHPAFSDMVANLDLDKIGLNLLLGSNEIRESSLAAAFTEQILRLLNRLATAETTVDRNHKQRLDEILQMEDDETYEDHKSLVESLKTTVGITS